MRGSHPKQYRNTMAAGRGVSQVCRLESPEFHRISVHSVIWPWVKMLIISRMMHSACEKRSHAKTQAITCTKCIHSRIVWSPLLVPQWRHVKTGWHDFDGFSHGISQTSLNTKKTTWRTWQRIFVRQDVFSFREWGQNGIFKFLREVPLLTPRQRNIPNKFVFHKLSAESESCVFRKLVAGFRCHARHHASSRKVNPRDFHEYCLSVKFKVRIGLFF